MRYANLKTGLAGIALVLSGTVSAAGDDMMEKGGMMGQGGMGEGETMTFESIDTNGDHSISREEAANRDDLKANWDRIDTDNNNQLDISEFSAFEGKGRYAPPEESEIPEPGAAPYDPGKP